MCLCQYSKYSLRNITFITNDIRMHAEWKGYLSVLKTKCNDISFEQCVIVVLPLFLRQLNRMWNSLLCKQILTANSGKIGRIPATTCSNWIRTPFAQSPKQLDILLGGTSDTLDCSSFPLFITFRGFYSLLSLQDIWQCQLVLTNFILASCIISCCSPSVLSHCLMVHAVKPQQQPDCSE